MSQKCTQVAIGGVFSALCVVVMCMTMLVPFGTYALPALAGAMLVAVVEENGRKAALMVYASVSLLAVFLVPDPEATMMFVAFFGYYPAARGLLARIRPAAMSIVLKLVLFNAAVVGGYLFLSGVLGMSEVLEGMGDFGRYTALVLLAVGNLIFVLYDFILEKYILIYNVWFKPKILRRR